MKNNQSAEDYLESILMLIEENGSARSIDVAAELGVTKPSVSVAMKKLREQGLIEMDENGLISFTEVGRSTAEKVYNKHKLLRNVLIGIGVDEQVAADEACQIEHVISDATYERIDAFYRTCIEKGYMIK
ncbi:MAG: metal-dependent transcriptional regulator [Lachnospiraceae bacterium]|nr:metal-dependent transcriptional regulator [Lachnospiraceae bacterium]